MSFKNDTKPKKSMLLLEPNIITKCWLQEQVIPINHQMWHHIKDIGRNQLQVIHYKKIQFMEEKEMNLMDINLIIKD